MATHHRALQRMVSMSIALISLVSACTAYNEAADVAETVDEAVTLLQDIEQRGSWDVIDDGLDALNDQETGYRARAHIQTSEQGTDATEMVMTIQVDSARNALVQVSGSESAGDYLILDYHPDTDTRQVYRVDDTTYACLTEDEVPSELQSGINSLFDTFAIRAIGIQVLSVVDRTDDELSIAERDSIHYELESKLDEAVLILDRLDNETLQRAVTAAGQFELTGNLYLDENTLALLGFDSTYDRTETQQRLRFDFEITQWGAIPAIPVPTGSDITIGCN